MAYVGESKMRLRYCDGRDKYLHPTGVKDVENIYF
jgi:hypothetical protein